MKAILVGAGGSGRSLYAQIKDEYDVIKFWDNDKAKSGNAIDGKMIELPDESKINDADVFIISSIPGLNPIKEQLLNYGIQENRIITKYVELPILSRQQFLKNFSELVYEKGIVGNCAEVGVFQGDFAKEINKNFPDRKLYLFDTFEGFAAKDIQVEKSKNYSTVLQGGYNMTSEELVLNKMQYKDNCIIKKGFFPETVGDDLLTDKFVFVNLDLDLYQPTLEGLNLFFNNELIVDEGILIVHDYFSTSFRGVRAAVNKFIEENKGYQLMPIGDSLSIAIIKCLKSGGTT